LAHRKTWAHRLVLEHHTLRAEHQAQAQGFGGNRKVFVDGGGKICTTGHCSNQKRSF
jgi:hypothetical protein